jgi:hypothetical protein
MPFRHHLDDDVMGSIPVEQSARQSEVCGEDLIELPDNRRL